ncbi:MAG: hypothetical protein H6845_00970 [Alphaproteobacteria bacterium]|nr:MAG: hypothetical protein H6845_00970 [Alphaproteobacteria bacterium]
MKKSLLLLLLVSNVSVHAGDECSVKLEFVKKRDAFCDHMFGGNASRFGSLVTELTFKTNDFESKYTPELMQKTKDEVDDTIVGYKKDRGYMRDNPQFKDFELDPEKRPLIELCMFDPDPSFSLEVLDDHNKMSMEELEAEVAKQCTAIVKYSYIAKDKLNANAELIKREYPEAYKVLEKLIKTVKLDMKYITESSAFWLTNTNDLIDWAFEEYKDLDKPELDAKLAEEFQEQYSENFTSHRGLDNESGMGSFFKLMKNPLEAMQLAIMHYEHISACKEVCRNDDAVKTLMEGLYSYLSIRKADETLSDEDKPTASEKMLSVLNSRVMDGSYSNLMRDHDGRVSNVVKALYEELQEKTDEESIMKLDILWKMALLAYTRIGDLHNNEKVKLRDGLMGLLDVVKNATGEEINDLHKTIDVRYNAYFDNFRPTTILNLTPKMIV